MVELGLLTVATPSCLSGGSLQPVKKMVSKTDTMNRLHTLTCTICFFLRDSGCCGTSICRLTTAFPTGCRVIWLDRPATTQISRAFAALVRIDERAAECLY